LSTVPSGKAVRALCSWCQAEGSPALLGEREPLENPTDTFGVCPRHVAAVLTAPRLRPSTTSVQLLIVVALKDRGLYEYLSRSFAAVEGVQVILERRQSERRGRSREVSWERRQGDRRQSRGVVNSIGCRFIRVGSINSNVVS
jgi:hypothetical protein